MKSTKPRMAISKQEIIKLLSIVGVMDMEEISRMFPDACGTIKTVVDHLFKDRRLTKVGEQIALDMDAINNPINGMKKALRVFSEFYPKAEYYTGEDYPGMFCFFADGIEYEILYAAPGQENIVNKVCELPDEPPKRLVVIESMNQIDKLKAQNTVAFCLVDDDGVIHYYQKK